MRIRHITVRKLFHVFDHEIPLNMNERITIIYGPNGFGKTYTLSLVNELFNPGFGDFFKIPFGSVSIMLENGDIVKVTKQESGDGETLTIRLDRHDGTSETFSFKDREEKQSKEPGWLKNLKKSVKIAFVHTERLIEISDDAWQSMNEKIQSYADNDSGRIELFAEIVNARFVQKRMKIESGKGIVFRTSYGTMLRPDDLSSGEKHVILLLYRLLFRVKPDSLILIDEPEISLHVFWQQEFLRDLQKIQKYADADILIATHSPQIIHDRWDLAVELKGPRS